MCLKMCMTTSGKRLPITWIQPRMSADYTETEIRLVRIKFISDMAN